MNIPIGRFIKDGFSIASVESAFRRVLAAITAGWAVEHNSDGTHSAVTADTITLGSDPDDGSWEGNVSGSLVPTTDGSDLGAIVTSINEDPRDHPWHDLRLSGTLYIGADWEATVIDGIPTLARTINGLTIDIEGQGEFVVTGSTAGELAMTSGNLSYDGNFDAVGAVTAGTDGFFERGRSTAVGAWTAVAHSAGNFTASTGTWTVDSTDQVTYAYTLVGKTMTLVWTINNTDVSAASVLRLAIPGGFTAASQTFSVHRAVDAGAAAVIATCRVLASGTYVEIFATAAAGNWTITAGDNTNTQGQITFEVA